MPIGFSPEGVSASLAPGIGLDVFLSPYVLAGAFAKVDALSRDDFAAGISLRFVYEPYYGAR